jgi:hypothetical protein
VWSNCAVSPLNELDLTRHAVRSQSASTTSPRKHYFICKTLPSTTSAAPWRKLLARQCFEQSNFRLVPCRFAIRISERHLSRLRRRNNRLPKSPHAPRSRITQHRHRGTTLIAFCCALGARSVHDGPLSNPGTANIGGRIWTR